MRLAWLLLLAGCAHSVRAADTPACVLGQAPSGAVIALRPTGAAPSVTADDQGRYEICGLRAGAYTVVFSHANSELTVDVSLAPGERRRLHACDPRQVPGLAAEDDEAAEGLVRCAPER